MMLIPMDDLSVCLSVGLDAVLTLCCRHTTLDSLNVCAFFRSFPWPFLDEYFFLLFFPLSHLSTQHIKKSYFIGGTC